MNATTKELTELIIDVQTYMLGLTEEQLEYRYAPGKWSKKEILGHLIDSAINNLQRFTEIQYAELPYIIKGYDQDKLVIANDYHHADIKHLLQLWVSLNHRIINVVDNLTIEPTKAMLEYRGASGNLKWLITDYLDHMKHHLCQIHGKQSTYTFEPKVIN